MCGREKEKLRRTHYVPCPALVHYLQFFSEQQSKSVFARAFHVYVLQTCNTITLDTRNCKYQAKSVASKSYSQTARSKESLLSMRRGLCKQRGGQCLLHWIEEVKCVNNSNSARLAPFRMPTPIQPASLYLTNGDRAGESCGMESVIRNSAFGGEHRQARRTLSSWIE